MQCTELRTKTSTFPDPSNHQLPVWDVYEYVGLAALDCAKTKLAEVCSKHARAMVEPVPLCFKRRSRVYSLGRLRMS
jgi:hypothetical protein